jgi:flagellar biosynthesis/type III secretory pathway protein FliH
MEGARLEGFERGRMAGLAEADASLLAERTRALGAMAALMAEADARASDVADRAAGLLAASLLGALRAAMPDLVAKSALGEASAMLAAVLPGLSRELRVRVEVPAAIAPGVAESLALMRGVQGRVDIQPVPAMEAGGVSVTWSAGEASRRPTQVWDEIMQIIAPLLGAEPMEEVTDD